MRLFATCAALAFTAFTGPVAQAQVTVDGVIDEAGYQVLATKEDANDNGFSDTNNLTELVYWVDTEAGVLYLGAKGVLEANGNGFGLFLNFSGPEGAVPGTLLGFEPDAATDQHFIDGEGEGVNDNFAADFQVDYMLAISNNSFGARLGAASKVDGTDAYDLVGTTDAAGAPATGPSSSNASFLSENSVTFAFDNTGGSDTGFEVAIPFDELGTSSAEEFEIFGVVVAQSAFFSNETIPGNPPGGNFGFNPEFGNVEGGPYHTEFAPLPVELVAFEAQADGNAAILSWATASETGNRGFEVQHRRSGETEWQRAAFVETEAPGGTSAFAHYYQHRLDDLSPGVHLFQLEQVDQDGSTRLSQVRRLEITPQGTYHLSEAGPNPFRTSARVTLALQHAQDVTVTLHDLQGREVARLHDGQLEGTSHDFTIDSGGLASGLYILRVHGERFSATRSLTLVR